MIDYQFCTKCIFLQKKKCMYVLFSVNEFMTRAIEPCKKFPPKSYILLNFLVYVNTPETRFSECGCETLFVH